MKLDIKLGNHPYHNTQSRNVRENSNNYSIKIEKKKPNENTRSTKLEVQHVNSKKKKPKTRTKIFKRFVLGSKFFFLGKGFGFILDLVGSCKETSWLGNFQYTEHGENDWIGFIPFQNMRQSTRTIQSVETFHGLEGKDENNIKKKVLIYVSFFNTYKEIKSKMSPQAKWSM